ncbi:MAG: SusC/RagA family TonB-linked outer membrane protein, partial [Prevotellaceae bacterium]|nr:SusC/RagA family TonB-linked outer membrane protein [Prevotellaceae bacterium]
MKINQYRTSTTRLMRLLLLAALICGFHSGAFAQNEKISLNVKDVNIRKFFDKIEEQSEYRFTYRDKSIDNEQRITYSTSGEAVESILQKILSPLGLQFQISKKDILITRKATAAESQVIKRFAGTVADNKGESIPGASISIKGTTIGVTSDIDGKFAIDAPVGSILIASYVGYAARELKLSENANLQITMQDDQTQLSEVVVVGYGTMRKSDVTGSLANIKASELALTTPTFGQALVGKIAGVQVSMPNGTPGAGVKIRVRGVGSLSAGSTPLYVVDGYPASEDVYINSEDVESIDVLKDAASAAIYGSRGANGVVLITTKRGASNKTRIDYDYQYGVAQLERKIKMMNAWQFRDLVIDARNNTYRDQLEAKGITWDPSFVYDDNAARRAKGGNNQTVIDPIFFDFTTGKPVEPEHNTDWQDAIYNNAAFHRHNVAISGGGEILKYRISAGYLDQDGIISPSSHKRINLRANVDAQVTKRLKANFNYSFSDVKERLIPDEGRFTATDGVIQSALVSYPQFPVYNPDGTYSVGKQIAMQADAYAQAENPVALAHEIDINQTESRMNF